MDANDPQSIDYFTKCLQKTKPEIALPVATIIFQSDERELLEKITTPCTIIQAKNDIVVPNSVAEFMNNKIKGKSTVEYVEATGHFPQLTSHIQFNEVLGRVL